MQQRRNASVLAQTPAVDKPPKKSVKITRVYNNLGPTPEKDRSTKTIHPSRREPEAVRAMASWYSWDGKGIDDCQVLRQLPVRTTALHVNTAIFFVTPRFAYLFEAGSNFLNAAMNQMFPTPFQKEKQQLKSIVAIVDAIPAVQNGYGQHSYVKSAEGIALCLTPTPHLIFDDKNGQGDPPVITFTTAFRYTSKTPQKNLQADQRDEEKVHSVGYSYTGIPANTLFVNGGKHTVILQNWERNGTSLMPQREVEHLSHLNVPIYSHDTREYTIVRLESNVKPLTKPAKIVSSMGNILRQISDDQGTVSASHELEIVVPPLAKTAQEKDPNAELQVFALIFPDSERTRELTAKLDGSKRAGSFTIQKLLLLEGARLHRVTSGGAGWGKKAGLLSLEPLTQLNQPSIQESPASFFPGFEIEDEMEESSTVQEKLLPEGHLVQFFAVLRKERLPSFHFRLNNSVDEVIEPVTKDSIPDPVWAQSDYFTPSRLQRMTIGTTTKEPVPTEEAETSKRTMFAPGSFGFLTASPIGVDVIIPEAEWVAPAEGMTGQSGPIPSTTIVHSTLVAIPNACFLANVPNGGKRVDVPDPNVKMIHPEVLEILNELAAREPVKAPEFHEARYIESFFQRVTGESRLGDIERFNRAITTSGIIRKLRGHHNKEQYLKRIIALTMGRRRIKQYAKNAADLAELTDLDDSNSHEPIIKRVKSDVDIRKVDQFDNRLKSYQTDYRAWQTNEFKEEMRQRAEEMAPSREQRYRTTKSVESEGETGVFDRQRKHQQAEKEAVGSLLDELKKDKDQK